VLINDLIRHPVHLAMSTQAHHSTAAGSPGSDEPASVRQAYTPREMVEILDQTAAVRIEIGRYYLFRMGVIVWKT